MYERVILGLLIATSWIGTGHAAGAEQVADASTTANWMVEQETAWAEQSCGKQWVLSDLLATDFRGTSPKGSRYDKPAAAPEPNPATVWHTDCRLLDADVRFFGTDVAVVYGSESSVAPLPGSRHERRCLVWTDTWLRRDGKWQIIAAQDARVDCPST
jgi:hypothetical protein